MARTARGDIPAGVYHVWRRTAGPIEMFRDDFDRTSFCRRLARSIAKYEWTCIAFILMPTHYHLLVEVGHNKLQPGMRDSFGPYAQEFNRRWGRSGHLRADRYKLRAVRDDRDLRGLVRYIARNPVRSKLCSDPQEWRWSSYPGTAGYGLSFPFVDDRLVLAPLNHDVDAARYLLRDVVEFAM